MNEPSPSTSYIDQAVLQALVSALQPYELLSYAIVDFAGDLAIADGPHYDATARDPRLGALLARSCAGLLRLYAMEQDPESRPALLDAAAWLESGTDATLGATPAPEN